MLSVLSRADEPQAVPGIVLQDREASDSMDPVCKAMELGRLMRMAIGWVVLQRLYETVHPSYCEVYKRQARLGSGVCATPAPSPGSFVCKLADQLVRLLFWSRY